DAAEFEKNLYLVRRRIEKKVIESQISGFYICSLSHRSIIYKGLFLAESLSDFYPDLRDARFESRVAIFHQRYSTNTFPQWWLAQPFRCLAHNGEINTVRGNKNWMLSHEIRMASLAFGEHSEDIKPVIPAGASDTAALDAAFEAICRSGRDAPTAKLMLVPEAWDDQTPESHLAMYKYLASVMEPWDGPAALAMTDGRWAVAGMDRNALRPLRYTRTSDGLLIVGSEAGMVVVPESTVLAKGRLGPGQMIAVDLDSGELLEDGAIKDRIAAEADYPNMIGKFLSIDDLAGAEVATPQYSRAELTRRQVAAGQTLEDMELILAPMVETAKEAIGSMGDDTPLAVISD
ncbi:MAG: glutamate synthase large subunit, partial [Sphingomonas sp.]